MADLKQMLEDYGADYQTTMGRFAGNEQIYLRIFSMLPKDKNMNKLRQALSDCDHTAAFDAAHTLKGVAGNLGLTPLQRALSEIVEPLRIQVQCMEYTSLYEKAQKEFERALNLLRELEGGEK